MRKDLNKRIDDILNSTKDSRRPKPLDNLFSKIERRINRDNGVIIPIGRLRLTAAAVAILLLVNALAISTYLRTEVKQNKQPNRSLISDYKLYE